MTDKPIVMHATSVRGLQAGRKTQTRRVLKTQPPPEWACRIADLDEDQVLWMGAGGTHCQSRIPYAVGDRLWVKEAWALMPRTAYSLPKRIAPDPDMAAYYRADFDRCGKPGWKSPRFMFRWASRITLTVTEVRVQRLGGISALDCYAEGCSRPDMAKCLGSEVTIRDNARNEYRTLWDSPHGAGAWALNPVVSATSFEVALRNIDEAAR